MADLRRWLPRDIDPGPFRFGCGGGASPQVVICDPETGEELERRPGGAGPVALRLPDNGRDRQEVSRG